MPDPTTTHDWTAETLRAATEGHWGKPYMPTWLAGPVKHEYASDNNDAADLILACAVRWLLDRAVIIEIFQTDNSGAVRLRAFGAGWDRPDRPDAFIADGPTLLHAVLTACAAVYGEGKSE